MARLLNLPEDTLIEILLRLPVKTLVRFKCVSKSWFSLLTCPSFIDMHLKFSLTRDDEFVLINRSEEPCQNILSLHNDDEFLSILVPNLEIQYLNDESPEIKAPNDQCFKLVGSSCNGIVCLFNDHNFALFNPATRQIRILPPHPPCPEGFYSYTEVLGFGFDAATDDYKVVIISQLDFRNPLDDHPNISVRHFDLDFWEAKIYSFTKDSWKELDYVPPLIHSFRPTGFDLFFNDRIHYIIGVGYECECRDPSILSLDISTELFHKFGYPKADKTSTDEDTGDYESLAIINDALALILYTGKYPDPHPFEQFIDVWIMKEYGNEESWSKQYSIGPLSGIIRPISIWKNNRILLERVIGGDLDHYEVQLAACDLVNCEQLLKYNDVHGHEFTMEVVFYKETLVSIAITKLQE
ncbi:hypothetical protein M9H77_09274 [Catharanthus roseus]|uniref:Uncharacterized protein n=1 Tax=Catharanthus roseus TaxID=4058 RepID=A0ACC0C0C3_CATRO|nr:hypothetical protein M9H77_09274 [Catharanthus roseus]